MKQTTLYQITETSKFMMSFAIVTQQDNVIVVDGGRPADMQLLKKIVKGRHISAWILTHAHDDHISGFVEEMKKDGCKDFDIEKVYYHFPEYLAENPEGLVNPRFYRADMEEMLPAFAEVLPKFREKAHVAQRGEQVVIDEVTIDFLYTWHPFLTTNLINDSSLVFKVTAPKKTVLFLGDLGPEGGAVLYRESRDLLKADLVQMAHHGHMCCGMEVYAAAAPEACLWCCPDWLYDEEELVYYLDGAEKQYYDGRLYMYGTRMTRRWMDTLGVKKHYVTKDGTHRIRLS